MHEIGAKMFDNYVPVCYLFRHLKVTNVDVVRLLGSWATTLYECHTTQSILIDNHRTTGVPLLLYEIL